MTDFDLAWINQIDAVNDIWSVQTRDKQFYKQKYRFGVPQHTDGYVAVVELNGSQFIRVLEAVVLQLPQDVVRTHFAWRQPDQLDAQGMLWHHAALIQDPALKEFLTNILLDAKIMHPFYIARASQDFHHNETGEIGRASCRERV